MRFDERVAVVTGGGSGIGLAVVERLATGGATVAAVDLQPMAAADAGAALSIPCDVSHRETVAEMVERVEAELGPISVLVNAAGWDRPSRFVDTEPSEWERVVAVNLWGPLLVTHAALRRMIAHDAGGAIVNVASDAGRVGSSGEVVYSAAKGGVIAFTKAVAREVARHHIRVNAVAPGPTDTPFLRAFTDGAEGLIDAMVRQTPLRRLAEPDDVAAAIAFLASDDARHITGQTLSVSGGLSMV